MFEFKWVQPEEVEFVQRSLLRPHLAKWIHGEGLENTRNGLSRFVLGQGEGQYWICRRSGLPFAFLITSAVPVSDPVAKDLPLEGDRICALDVFLLSENSMGRGLGPRMIRAFVEQHLAAYSDVVIDPENANVRAIRAYEKVGFTQAVGFIASWHPVPHTLMHLPMTHVLAHSNPNP